MLYLEHERTRPSDRKHAPGLLRHPARRPGARWRLYLPEHYPQIDDAMLTQLRKAYHEQGYAELAFQILSLYIDDIPAADLHGSVRQDLHRRSVRHRRDRAAAPPGRRPVARSPVQRPHAGLQGHGHAAAGQPVRVRTGAPGRAAQHPGRHQSGDTGSAAEYAMRGKQGVRVFMTSPHGRMSPFQQAQMFSLQDENIHNIAIEGVFDDCQDIVKAVSNDLEFKRKYKIGTVNSINWARLLAQVVYYFAGYVQATCGTETNDQKVSFTVPSGNFGNICAGHVARMMGLPIDKLVVATNENDVLDEFFRTGVYRVRGSADTHETSSPSMDISKASNFERFVFDLLGRDGPAHQGAVRRCALHARPAST
jgi:threonine synthase